MNEIQFCHECERMLDGDEGHIFDGVTLCEECFRTKTARCDCCGDRIWR